MGALEGRIVLDASVLIELLAGSPAVKPLVEAIIAGRVEAYTSRLSIVEALYVTCRLWGMEKARERLQNTPRLRNDRGCRRRRDMGIRCQLQM
ncbi:PIN domain-containing protein [Hyperthermus butylicus]|uniref:PIN domain-containing protein n=1 Tax=Hyperthermus butylicus TaxID=54248 RepID=UPI000322ECB2|nr:PIN domain-containing protein [Hyperthermus butylicus]